MLTPSSKMVNVNAHSPFHLHADHSAPSSRNVSGGTLPSSRAASPSPARLQKSASTASLRPDEDAPHYLPLVVSPSVPILNVRLIKSPRSLQSTRGRPQRTGDPNGRAQTLEPDLAPHQRHAPPTSDHVSPFLVSRDHLQSYLCPQSNQKRHLIPRTSTYTTQVQWHVHGETNHICLVSVTLISGP